MLWRHQVLRGDTDLEMLHYGAWGRGAHETLRSNGGIGLTWSNTLPTWAYSVPFYDCMIGKAVDWMMRTSTRCWNYWHKSLNVNTVDFDILLDLNFGGAGYQRQEQSKVFFFDVFSHLVANSYLPLFHYCMVSPFLWVSVSVYIYINRTDLLAIHCVLKEKG